MRIGKMYCQKIGAPHIQMIYQKGLPIQFTSSIHDHNKDTYWKEEGAEHSLMTKKADDDHYYIL